MRRSAVFNFKCVCVSFTAVLVVLQGAAVSTQQSLPWTGVAIDEARSVDTGAVGAASVRSHALSADGRFVTFTANYPLISNDANGFADVYVRDRMTGAVELISHGSDGSPANDNSDPSAISEDGRHVAFLSSASNLVDGDTNGQQDVFVHDRVTQITSLVSLGVNGEPAQMGIYDGISLSANGRFVTFGAIFDNYCGCPDMFLRDRDPDMNGVFDEPGLATTTRIAVDDVGPWHLYFANEAVVSPDGRYVAFTASSDQGGLYASYGIRVFLLDRDTSTTIPVDVPPGDFGDFQPEARGLSLSNGHLAYVTNVDNLVEDDVDGLDNVFVYDIAAGTNAIVRSTLTDMPALSSLGSTSISADGRYLVAFGSHEVEGWRPAALGFAVDRETSQTRELGLRPDGTRTDSVFSGGISADGSAIAFSGSPEVMVVQDPLPNSGVYVDTALSLSPAAVEVPEEGGGYAIEVSAPANTSWTVQHDPAISVSPESGVGSATLQVAIDPNTTGVTRVVVVAVGSESTTFKQLVPLTISTVSPGTGPITGGTEVDIIGSGFTLESTVSFGGVPAASMSFFGSGYLRVTTPAHANGPVDVVVSDPVSPPGTLVGGFYYGDATPPVLTPAISGVSGRDDWYRSDVYVSWDVTDPESPIEFQSCDETVIDFDTVGELVTCSAQSAGGVESASVQIKRDTTRPVVSIYSPEPIDYRLNQFVDPEFTCEDATSGVATCASTPGTFLDTSTVGPHTFTVTATDVAGNTTRTSVIYTVKAQPDVSLQPASGTYGGSMTLFGRLTLVGAGLEGKTLAFFIDNVAVGTATTDATGVASLQVSLAATNAGSHTYRAFFAGDATNFDSTGTSSLTIAKATTSVSWNTPAGITYGTALGATQLNATASVPGAFVYTPGAGTVLSAGTRTLSVSFTPSDSTNYLGSSGSVSIVVTTATPSITWNAPAPITYGTALSATQLNATASVGGTFVYTPGIGTVLGAGPQTLSVSFTPNDTANYNSTSATRSIAVNPAALTIQANNSSKVYGEALPAFTVSATGFVNGDSLSSLTGTLSFTTSASASGAPGAYPVTPGGVSSANYAISFVAGTLTIAKAESSVTLAANPNPSRPNRDVVLEAVVSAVAPGAGVATGSVEFRENGTLLGTAALVNGVATFTTSFKKGAHPLTATYIGDANFTGSSGSATVNTTTN